MSSESVAKDTGRPQKTQALNVAFAERLNRAMEHNPNFPPKFDGRNTYLMNKLSERGVKISGQTVHRWSSGAVMPSKDKMPDLAAVLGVDPIWLALGDGDSKPSRSGTRANAAGGLVDVLALLITNDGGEVTWPDEVDHHAATEAVDLYASIKGGFYAFRAAPGKQEGDDAAFTIRSVSDKAIVLGIVQDGFSFKIFDLTEFLGNATTDDGAGFRLAVRAADLENHRIETFSKRP